MAAIQSIDNPGEPRMSGSRRRLGWLSRVLLISLVLVTLTSSVLFGGISLGDADRAEATVYYDSGDGCYRDWVQATYFPYAWTGTLLGCQFYWGGYWFYKDYANNRVLIWANGRWQLYSTYVNSTYPTSYGRSMGYLMETIAYRNGTVAY